jgi:hypothetical protein
MSPNQFISYLEGLLAAQEKETKLSKAIRAKLKEVSSEEEWQPSYFRPDYKPPVIVPLREPSRDEFRPYC